VERNAALGAPKKEQENRQEEERKGPASISGVTPPLARALGSLCAFSDKKSQKRIAILRAKKK
jgi:hypothetical protein